MTELTNDGAYEDVFVRQSPLNYGFGKKAGGIDRVWSAIPWAAVAGWTGNDSKIAAAAVRACARAEKHGAVPLLKNGRSILPGGYSVTATYMHGPNRGEPWKILVDNVEHERDTGFMWVKGVMDRHGTQDAVSCYLRAVDVAVAGLERSQQPVHKIPDLGRYLQTPSGQQMVEQRIALVDAARGVRNTVVVDGNESYEILNAQMGAAQSIIQAAMQRVCAVTGIPSRVLWGEGEGGLGGGNADQQLWRSIIRQYQQSVMTSVLEWVSGKTPEYEPLDRESATDRAQRLDRIASALDRLLSHAVIDPMGARKLLAEEGFLTDGYES